MIKYFRYTRYVFVHKWHVMIACWRRGLFIRGITHDLSKFRPDEFFPYARFFYGDESGSLMHGFDLAWLKHQRRNDHHWQWWMLYKDDGDYKLLEMSRGAMVEMLCDWIGAGKAQGKSDTRTWYQKNRHTMKFHPKVKTWIEKELRI